MRKSNQTILHSRQKIPVLPGGQSANERIAKEGELFCYILVLTICPQRMTNNNELTKGHIVDDVTSFFSEAHVAPNGFAVQFSK